MAKLSFDPREYNLDSISHRANKIDREIKLEDANAEEKLQVISVLLNAREPFTLALKNEMITAKAGFDLNEE